MLEEVSDDEAPDAPDWRKGLLKTGTGAIKRCMSNAVLVFKRHADWQNVLAFDEFAGCVVKLRPPPTHAAVRPDGEHKREWDSSDTLRAAFWLQRKTGADFSSDITEAAIKVLADTRRIHPVREYLHSLHWDGKVRLPTWLHTYLGVKNTELHSDFGRCWLVSGVARIMSPGCKVDTMLILEGSQGHTKGQALRIIGGEWFADTQIRLDHGQDAYQALRSKWIYEIQELNSFKGKAVTRIKEYVSSSIDTYRESYGNRTKDVPRQVIFAGTTNENHYFLDRSGNRRFWPVRCGRVSLKKLAEDRDQLWAEAFERYMRYVTDKAPPHERVEKWWLTSEEAAREAQAERLVPEEWAPRIAEYLARSGKTVTVKMDNTYQAFDIEKGLPVWAVALGALELPASRLDHASATRVGIAMQDLGWLRCRTSVDGMRQWRYFPPSYKPEVPDDEIG